MSLSLTRPVRTRDTDLWSRIRLRPEPRRSEDPAGVLTGSQKAADLIRKHSASHATSLDPYLFISQLQTKIFIRLQLCDLSDKDGSRTSPVRLLHHAALWGQKVTVVRAAEGLSFLYNIHKDETCNVHFLCYCMCRAPAQAAEREVWKDFLLDLHTKRKSCGKYFYLQTLLSNFFSKIHLFLFSAADNWIFQQNHSEEPQRFVFLEKFNDHWKVQNGHEGKFIFPLNLQIFITDTALTTALETCWLFH